MFNGSILGFHPEGASSILAIRSNQPKALQMPNLAQKYTESTYEAYNWAKIQEECLDNDWQFDGTGNQVILWEEECGRIYLQLVQTYLEMDLV